ncbi:MAG: polysaccharide deacetylase family protein [Bacteroidales bacterium]|nr:polysaccharide deacetylase family protein [Bacteroidales bacterium]
MDKYCLLSNDVETTSIWFNSLRDETGSKVLREGMPKLLDIYSKYNISTTFFVTGYIAKLYPEIVKMILPFGHEIGSHGLSHEKKHGFDILNHKEQIEHLRESKKILEDLSGKEVISFRSPALRLSNNTVSALEETGYRIDSSVAAQRFDMFMSFGGVQKVKWLTAPRLPYRTDPENIFKKGNSKIIEVPLTAFGFPYVGTTMRIFPLLTNIQKHLFNFEAKLTGKPIVFDIHPNEFIDESDEHRNIEKRGGNLISSFLQDTLRSRLKVKNLGMKAIPLYESQIKFFKKKVYKFATIKDYVKQQGFKI